jgi:hypothetical protein
MRQMLKFNSKNYLQQDLRDYIFDCYIVPPRGKAQAEPTKAGVVKYKVWVGGARREMLQTLESLRQRGRPDPEPSHSGLLGPINALEFSQPETFARKPWRGRFGLQILQPSASWPMANYA